MNARSIKVADEPIGGNEFFVAEVVYRDGFSRARGYYLTAHYEERVESAGLHVSRVRLFTSSASYKLEDAARFNAKRLAHWSEESKASGAVLLAKTKVLDLREENRERDARHAVSA